MDIDWNIWARCEALPLHQAAALLAGVAPEKVNPQPPFVRAPSHALTVARTLNQAGIPRRVTAPNSPVSYGEYNRRQVEKAAQANEAVRRVLIVAQSAVASGSLKLLSNGQVLLRDFVGWAKKDFTIPAELQGYAVPREYSDLSEAEQAYVSAQLYEQYASWRRDSDTHELTESVRELLRRTAADDPAARAEQELDTAPAKQVPSEGKEGATLAGQVKAMLVGNAEIAAALRELGIHPTSDDNRVVNRVLDQLLPGHREGKQGKRKSVTRALLEAAVRKASADLRARYAPR